MTDHVPIRRALLSVSDKTGLAGFARALADRGIEIISTGGTARALAEAGLTVIPVEKVTGFPEMMDGRIKTLHPLVHGGILARRDLDEHRRAMADHDISAIDLVCINLYPFEETVRRRGVTEDDAIEQIDIGGPAMVRSAAKNHRFVTVVTSPGQYDDVIAALAAHDGATPLALRRRLATAAFTRTAEYDTAISNWMTDPEAGAGLPATLIARYTRHGLLRYGENPHQDAACYIDPAVTPTGVVAATLHSGKPLSYNNLNDAAAALALVEDAHATFPGAAAAALIKHTNPCGLAVASSLADAFQNAYAGDPRAAYGGILAVNTPIDDAVAAVITEGQRFLEVIITPDVSETACAQLAGRWKNVRILTPPPEGAGGGSAAWSLRSIPGGALVQQRDDALPTPDAWRHVAGPAPDAGVLRTATLAWLAVKHLSSNAIAIARNDRLIGAGSGQVDRLTACQIAIDKAVVHAGGAAGAVAASDAFFPFADGPELLIDAGVNVIVQPGGSKRDEETIALCSARNVTCLLTGIRHFRH